jgi:hypothetical protein
MKLGFRIFKSGDRTLHLNNEDGDQVVDDRHGVLDGVNQELTLEQVPAFLAKLRGMSFHELERLAKK